MFESPSSPPAKYRYQGQCLGIDTYNGENGWWFISYGISIPFEWAASDVGVREIHRNSDSLNGSSRAHERISLHNTSTGVCRVHERMWYYGGGAWTAGEWNSHELAYDNISSSNWDTAIGSGHFLKMRTKGALCEIHGYIEAGATPSTTIATLSTKYRPPSVTPLGQVFLPAAYYRTVLGDWRACCLSIDGAGALKVDNWPGFTVTTGDIISVKSEYPRMLW